MRPGRLPETDPREQAARAKLRAPSTDARAKQREQAQAEQANTTPAPTRRARPATPVRWT